MNDQPVYTADEFERESHHIDTLVWEATMVERGSKVLFCGYGPDGAWVRRALEAGADVTVIEHRNEAINKFATLPAKLLRGSTSVIPAKENAFDLAISYHYLHEIDPFFHSQVLSELARVARRVAVIEPAPPADPLGKRIALLYSQAKRELGQFEYYQPLEYWKKLLQAVKVDVSQHVFAFSKVPPREYLHDSVRLMLDTIEAEDAPKEFMDELRQIAQRSDIALLPPPRYVLVGAAAGELPTPHFTARMAPPLTTKRAKVASTIAEAVPPERHEPTIAREVSVDTGYEFPPIEAPPPLFVPPPAAHAPQAPAPPFTPGLDLPFGSPAPPDQGMPQPGTPFGAPFMVPGMEGGNAPQAPSSWEWEPPEEEKPQ
jgi:hypothetical protein